MESFFSASGRLNRRPYFFRGLALSIPSYLLGELPKAWGISLGLFAIPALILILAALVLIFLQAIKRLHDLDLSGWWSLVFVIPIINFGLGLYLTFAKGTDGPNRFGADPLATDSAAAIPANPASPAS